MAEYLTLVITASFFCTLISALMGDKGAGKTGKAAIRILMIAVIILPVIRTVKSFSNDLALPVINESKEHIIDNGKDEVKVYREWIARVTVHELSQEIESSVKAGMGILVRVECPWHFEGDDVVFEKLKVYTDAKESLYTKIENYIKIHYTLDSECFKETQ